MKVILIQGDDGAKLAERLNKFIDTAHSRSWKIERVSGSIRETLTSTSLFDEERFFILEDVGKINKKDSEWFKKEYKNLVGNLVVVHRGILTKTQSSLIPKPDTIETFEIPKKIWTFLESFYPGNSKVALFLLRDVLQKDAIELVSALLARHLRDLFLVKIEAENSQIPPWRLKKLSFQSDQFSYKGLKDAIKGLSQADYKAKTGAGDFAMELDFLIAMELQ